MNPDDVQRWIEVLDAVTNRPLLLLIIYVIWQNRQAIVARLWDEHDKRLKDAQDEIQSLRSREKELIDRLSGPN